MSLTYLRPSKHPTIVTLGHGLLWTAAAVPALAEPAELQAELAGTTTSAPARLCLSLRLQSSTLS